MGEFKFVLKCFAFAAVLLVITQMKAGDTTIENHIQSSLINSKVADFVNKTADGGVKLIKDASTYIKQSYLNWKRSESSEPAKLNEPNVEEVSAEEPQNVQAQIQTEPDTNEDVELVDEE